MAARCTAECWWMGPLHLRQKTCYVTGLCCCEQLHTHSLTAYSNRKSHYSLHSSQSIHASKELATKAAPPATEATAHELSAWNSTHAIESAFAKSLFGRDDLPSLPAFS